MQTDSLVTEAEKALSEEITAVYIKVPSMSDIMPRVSPFPAYGKHSKIFGTYSNSNVVISKFRLMTSHRQFHYIF